jgi:hypothetical protein
MWFVAQDAILTKDNMLRRKWQGDPGCYLCGVSEDRDHLFSCKSGVGCICFMLS